MLSEEAQRENLQIGGVGKNTSGTIKWVVNYFKLILTMVLILVECSGLGRIFRMIGSVIWRMCKNSKCCNKGVTRSNDIDLRPSSERVGVVRPYIASYV